MALPSDTLHAASDAAVPATENNRNVRKGVLFATDTGSPALNAHLEHIRAVDWASTSLGPLQAWPDDLNQLCHVALLEPQPRLLLLGHEQVLFYNEAYGHMCGERHPYILGQPITDAWSDLPMETVLGPQAAAERSGLQVEIKNSPLIWKRNGVEEKIFLSWTVICLVGSTPGFYVSLVDVTESLLLEKRRAALRILNHTWMAVKDPVKLLRQVPSSLNADHFLFPFAFLYSLNDPTSLDTSSNLAHHMRFKLVSACGDSEVTSVLPDELTPSQCTLFSTLIDPVLIHSNDSSWSLTSRDYILCPIRSSRSEKIIAFLCLGKDDLRPYNEPYETHVHEVTGSLRTAITSALLAEDEEREQRTRAVQAAEEQHKLAVALASRDREATAVTDQFQRTLQVVDMAGVGVFEYDMDGRLIYANDAFCAMSNCPRELMFGEKLVFLDLMYPEDHEYIMSKWNHIVTGVSSTFEMRFSSANRQGQGLWVQAACVPVIDENGVIKSVSGCTTNIHDTKMREAESIQRLQALERAKSWEQRFANFAELAPIAIYFGTHEQKKLSYCNRAWFEMTGHPVVPPDQIDWPSVVLEDDLDIVQNNWIQVTTLQKAVSVQFRLKRRWQDRHGVSIGPCWVTCSALPEYTEDGSIKGIIGVMQDISALKFAETVQQMKVQEAVEQRRQQENFIDMTSHEIRNPLGAVIHCSDATSETFSEMTELVKRLSLTSPGEYAIAKQLQELITNGLDSINTIISCSTHQKRIVDDILVLSKLDSNLLQIAPSAVEVTTLIRDIEKMFEAEAQRSDVILSTRAHPSLQELNVGWAMLDPGRVQQVLINLVTNAIKFCKGRTQRRVTVTVGASTLRPSEDVMPDLDFAVAHSLHDSIYEAAEFAKDTFYLWFRVEDTGRGMTAEEKGKIFARFCQGSPRTYNEYGGSGLGLFISRELSELQGGEIGVASEPDVGSTFAFFIKTQHIEPPIMTRLMDLPNHTRTVSDASALPASQVSVLVVEDNPVNQRVLKKRLEKHGYSVSVADDGLDCLSYLETTTYWRNTSPTLPPSTSTPNPLSVILMDIEMPKMDGLTATKRIRELESQGQIVGHIPIIAVSANARHEQTALALKAGMDDAIAKPFRITDLVPKIERLAGWARVE